MCSWVSPPTMWTVVTRTMLDPSPTFPSMRETFAFHGRAAIRSGAGDLGNEGGRDPGGNGAPSPAEAIALPGQRPSPAPGISVRHSRGGFSPGPCTVPTLGE